MRAQLPGLLPSASVPSRNPARRGRYAACAAALFLAIHGAALAQTPGNVETVSWTASVQSADGIKPGSRQTITLKAAILEGWHVYAFEQLPAGPIPLAVTLSPSEIAAADGAPTATTPTKFLDPSFRLETQFYADTFTVTVPVRIAPSAAPGAQQIPVSVRFQSCNGQTCRPPKTVRLSAAVNVKEAG